MLIKNYNAAPLPFQGQKRRFITEFRKALEVFSFANIFVDLFGGSGLLSHVIKQVYPNKIVVYNDFDNYSLRLENIERTNILLRQIRILLANVKPAEKIPVNISKKIFKIIQGEERENGYVDYITLSASLMFSCNYVTNFVELSKSTLYNRVRNTDYPLADDYLTGIKVVHKDYKELFKEYKNNNNVVFIVDPPYLSTDTSTYTNTSYWKLSDYLDVLKVLDGTFYIYFTSNKSSVLELCVWIERNLNASNPFNNCIINEISVRLNHSSTYKDIMLYKK